MMFTHANEYGLNNLDVELRSRNRFAIPALPFYSLRTLPRTPTDQLWKVARSSWVPMVAGFQRTRGSLLHQESCLREN